MERASDSKIKSNYPITRTSRNIVQK